MIMVVMITRIDISSCLLRLNENFFVMSILL